MPRWPAPELPAAASYLACWFGAEGRRRAGKLLSGADPAVPVRVAGFGARWDPAVEARLRQELSRCVMGVRVILAGPEALVMRAMALARRLGASPEELVPVAIEAGAEAEYVTGPAARRVFCGVCRAAFGAVAAVGGAVTCPGCGASLFVDQRYSRPRAAYFGWPSGLDLHQ